MPTATPRYPAIRPVQRTDPLASLLEATLVGNDIVRDCEAFVTTRLCRQDAPRLFLGLHVAREQSRRDTWGRSSMDP